MKVTVDKKVCIGCGLCTSLAERVFEMNKEKSQPKKDADMNLKKNQKEAVEAQNSCPVSAINIS